eukprot:452799_1
MSYMILQRNQPSLQVLQHSEIINNILIQKIDILTDVCQQIQMQWQYKYYKDQKAWQYEINKQQDHIALLQKQIENQKCKLNAKEKQIKESKEHSIHLETKYKKDKKSLKSRINQYNKTNTNLKSDNTEQKAQIYVLRYDLKQHQETIIHLQKQINEMKLPIRQCMKCTSSSTLKIHYTSIDYSNHSFSHDHSMEQSLFVLKKPSTNSIVSDFDHQRYKWSNSTCISQLPHLPMKVNQLSVLSSNAYPIKRSTSVDTARSISRLQTYFKKQFITKDLPKIPNSKTDICEELEINEHSK